MEVYHRHIITSPYKHRGLGLQQQGRRNVRKRGVWIGTLLLWGTNKQKHDESRLVMINIQSRRPAVLILYLIFKDVSREFDEFDYFSCMAFSIVQLNAIQINGMG